MVTRALQVLLRACLLLAMTASAALLVDYRHAGTPTLCAAQSGCAQVRAWAASHFVGLRLPMVGLVALALLFAGSLWATERRQARLVALGAVAAALGAIALVVIQAAVIRAFCPWCLAVDGAALVAAAAAVALGRRQCEPEPALLRYGWAGCGVGAVAVPLLLGSTPGVAELPVLVASRQRADRIDVVSFTDFQCPFCRQLHPVLHEAAAADGRLRVVRMMVPLPFHPGAEPAARAYLCVPEPLRERMADALYRAEPETMSSAGVAALATGLGCDAAAFAACYSARATGEQIAADLRAFEQAGLEGLPSTYVERELVLGADDETLRAALARAGRPAGSEARAALGLLGVVSAAMAAVSLFVAWRRRASRAGEAAGAKARYHDAR
jgi:uncharacterized membrane protein/predicted DsbA family dithiol-disulfide isomerase